MRNGSRLSLASGATALGAYFLLGAHPAAQTILFLTVGVSAVSGVLVGVRRNRPPAAATWLLCAAALAGLVLGDVLRSAPLLLGIEADTGRAAGVLYAATYPLLALAVVLKLRHLAAGVKRETTVDGAILAAAAVLVGWDHVFGPLLESSAGALQGVATLAHPVGDVLVLAALGGLLLAVGFPTTSERLLAGGFGLLLVGDVLHLAPGAGAGASVGRDALWLGSFLLFAAASLHPSTARRGAAGGSQRWGPGRRLAVVAGTGLAALALLAGQAVAGAVAPLVVVLGATVLAGLLAARLVLIVSEVDRLRRRAELSEARFRMLFDAAPVGIALPPDDDPLSGRMAQTNRAFQEMVGYTGAELAELHWRDITVPGSAEDEILFEELLTGDRQSYRVEKRYRRKDGTTVPVNVHVALARAEDGTPRLAIGLSEDIAERKAAEAELRLAEERYRTLVESLPLVSYVDEPTPDSSPIYISPQVEELLGYPTEEWLEGPGLFQRILHPGDRDRVRAEHERALASSATSWSFEYRLIARDGRAVWLRDDAVIARDAAGRPLSVEGFLLDVTAQKHAELALVESEQRFRDLVSGLEAMVWECSVADWGYTFVSDGVEELLGFPAEQWLADPDFWVERLHPDDRDWVVERARSGERDRVGWAVEYRMLAADGREVWVRDVVRVVCGADGSPERLRGVLIDITASKLAEQERDHLLEQLRQKQKLEALGQLAGGVAHDFNNLLTAISGYGELALARANGDERLRGSIEQIGRCADRAAALTGQLLAFGRRQRLSPRVLELDEVVTGMDDLIRHLVGDTVDVRLSVDGSVPSVEADPGQLEQVILNLAVNARDAMPSGGTLEVGTSLRRVGEGEERADGEEPVPAGEYAALTVSDTGTGMDDDVRRRAFDPFFTTKEPGEGTGLGLSTVYGIVKQSGGHVLLRSAPGAGTAVTILLPRASGPAAEAAAPRHASPAPGGSETILLVEDEPTVRDVLEASLTEDGFTVLAAADGVEALELAAAHQGTIDVLLTDLSMPRMGGLELVQLLGESRPATRVLLMSGYAEGIPPGVALLSKPFGLAELRSRVRLLLAEPQAA